jgi:hypothetical protein
MPHPSNFLDDVAFGFLAFGVGLLFYRHTDLLARWRRGELRGPIWRIRQTKPISGREFLLAVAWVIMFACLELWRALT